MKLRRMTLLENSKKKLGEKLREALGGGAADYGNHAAFVFYDCPHAKQYLNGLYHWSHSIDCGDDVFYVGG